jgi:hypothetical protein
MKKIILLLIISFLSQFIKAQNVGINATGAVPAASAMLDVSSSNKGALLPRVGLLSITDVVTIPSPAVSLLVYNTLTAGAAPNNVYPGFYYWDGAKWVRYVDFTVERWIHPAANYAPGAYAITSTIPGVTPSSSVFINLIGNWPATPNVTIQHIEARTGEVRFRFVNNTASTTYTAMDFLITIIR